MSIHQQTSPNATKIAELESIRGLAAFLMVFHHLPKWNPILSTGFINNSHLLVEVFFVLSGFVIFNAYSGKIKTRTDLLRFQFLRLGRLYPVHILFLLAFVAIEFAKYLAASKLGVHSPNSTPFETNNPTAFVKNLLLIQSVLPNQELTFNHPAWSISVEFYTYLIFASILLVFKRSSDILFFTLAVISLSMLSTGDTFGFESLLRCFAGFFLGCLTSKFTRHAKFAVPGLVAPVLFVSIVLFLQFKTEDDLDLPIYLLTAGLIAALVLSSPRGLLKRALNLPVLTWLGTISYSMYMSHFAIEWVVNQAVRVVLKKPEVVLPSGRSVPQLSSLEAVLASLAAALAVLAVSALVYNLLEKPMREKSRRFAFSKLTDSTTATLAADGRRSI